MNVRWFATCGIIRPFLFAGVPHPLPESCMLWLREKRMTRAELHMTRAQTCVQARGIAERKFVNEVSQQWNRAIFQLFRSDTRSCEMHIHLQNLVLIQPRTSSPIFLKDCEFGHAPICRCVFSEIFDDRLISSKRILRLRRFVGVDPEFLPTSRSAASGITEVRLRSC